MLAMSVQSKSHPEDGSSHCCHTFHDISEMVPWELFKQEIRQGTGKAEGALGIVVISLAATHVVRPEFRTESPACFRRVYQQILCAANDMRPTGFCHVLVCIQLPTSFAAGAKVWPWRISDSDPDEKEKMTYSFLLGRTTICGKPGIGILCQAKISATQSTRV